MVAIQILNYPVSDIYVTYHIIFVILKVISSGGVPTKLQ